MEFRKDLTKREKFILKTKYDNLGLPLDCKDEELVVVLYTTLTGRNDPLNTLPDEFINEFHDFVDWNSETNNYYGTEGVLKKERDIIKWERYVDWEVLSENFRFSEKFVRDHQDKINFKKLSANFKFVMSKDFVYDFCDKLDWYYVSIRSFESSESSTKYSHCEKLDLDFYHAFEDKFDWYTISKNGLLPNDFIKEFQDKLDLVTLLDHTSYWYTRKYIKSLLTQ